jgi:dTDP-4-amino-4,6-dideoxygalactose transaminase
MLKPFNKEIYVTRPLLPDLGDFNLKLKEVWDSQWLSNNGKQHQALEEKVKERLKVPYTCLFNNGTIALITAIQSLRLTGEVITTPFTFPATPHVLAWNNIRPIFCDINPQTLNIDAKKIEPLITPATTGILGVHVFGMPCEVTAIQEVADRYGLKVIYDAAHAFETEIDGTGIGNYGDISMFSFHPTKLFHTGEGGCLTFRDNSLKQRIDLLKNFGIKNQETVMMPGINGKMNEIQAALGLQVLGIVDKERERRQKLLEVYYQELENLEGVHFYKKPADVKNSYQYFVISINKEKFGKSRDFVCEKFKRYNVFARKYFHPLCSEYTCYKHLPSSNKDNLPVAHQIVNEVLCLPFYGGLSASDIRKICAILRSFK